VGLFLVSTRKLITFIVVLIIAGIVAAIVNLATLNAGYTSQNALAFALIAFTVLTIVSYSFIRG
jgi:hypothetical protein